jgi:hypothetical protein
MDIRIAREVSARIWCDSEMSHVEMDCELAETIAQLLSRLTPLAPDAEQRRALGEQETGAGEASR